MLNLPSLSRRESEELAAALAEAERRKLPITNLLVGTTAYAELAPYPDSPQERAYVCEADVVGYGGAAGGGKSWLALMKAANLHHRSIVFRRVSTSLEGIIKDSRDHFPARPDWRFVLSPHPEWRFDGRRTLRFADMQHEENKEKWRGNPHDFITFEEATEFSRSQVEFAPAWNRSTVTDPRTKKPYRCQTLLTFNPPQNEAGQWIIDYFGAWLNPQHPHPAADGEWRWYTTIGGQETELLTGDPVEVDGEWVTPRSRTFFRASLADNPVLAATDYGATINALPEPMRSLMKGRFDLARRDDLYQVIPTLWVEMAMARWANTPKPDLPLSAVGVDVARGGKDATVIAPRHGVWFDAVQSHLGISTTDGWIVADHVMPYAQQGAEIIMDVIAVGTSPYDICTKRGYRVVAFNGAASPPEPRTDMTGTLTLLNLRAWAYWKMREALDPANGQDVCLPPDPELKADLCAARWEMTPLKLKIEDKAEIKKRVGRSPDKGDAVVMAAFVPPHESIDDWIAWLRTHTAPQE